ncbi:MAG TPA: hypothetical protein VFZ77_16090 [Acidimicrobiales bacterium]
MVWLLAVLVASCATGLAAVFLLGATTALRDSPPAGPSCRYELDPGSGWVGLGAEEIRWGAVPTKHCIAVYEDPRGAAQAVDNTLHPFGVLSLLVFPAAAVAGFAAGLGMSVTATYMLRRP